MKPRNAHPADVIASLRKQGGSLSALAKTKQLHHSTLGHSLRRCIPTANRAIAKFLETNVHQLWPEWFDAKGRRLGTHRDPSHKGRSGKSQISPSYTDRSDKP